jgi:uncharacterized protein
MPNALQQETSPYLLQHADNPVDWLPWGPEALARAREGNKPILLSIGYSACHWCHVMAHESFEDVATAALMNELFVNIKVDREERPDLDRIYQKSQQLFTGRPGGWPLTMFLTPDEQWPIFAGTYFPKTAAYGMPAFSDVLTRVADYFRNHRSEIDTNARLLLDALARPVNGGETTAPSESLSRTARQRLGEVFDAANGGFGQAPKFPHPTEIGLLLTLSGDDPGARAIAEQSLNAMASGGLFDHLGGGFFRYCVDNEWRIPHFEKMLYDNAALLGVFSEAFALTGNRLLAGAADATARWVLHDMRDPGGGFYATLDADSDGEEGRFYCFTREEIETAIDAEESDAAGEYYGVDQPANFEGKSWHLQPRTRVAPFGEAAAPIESARRKLLAVREKRVRPGRDEKILTAWNGLMIGNLAKAARYLDQPDLGRSAQQAVDFIRATLWCDSRLFASFKDDRARFAGYLDDYAFLAIGLTELLQWQFRPADLEFAIELADGMLEHFADPAGGFFFTADDHERLIHRPKPLADEAVPSGNGTAALVFDTLGHLLGESRYLKAAGKTVDSALAAISSHPEAHATLLKALDRQLHPPELVVVRGSETSLAAWRARIDTGFNPSRLVFFIDDDVDQLPGLLQTRAANEATTAYLCRGVECLAPIQDIEELQARLNTPPGDRPLKG